MKRLRGRTRELEDQMWISDISMKKSEHHEIYFTNDKANDLLREQELKGVIKYLEAQFKVKQRYTRNTEDWVTMAKGKEMDFSPKIETMN